MGKPSWNAPPHPTWYVRIGEFSYLGRTANRLPITRIREKYLSVTTSNENPTTNTNRIDTIIHGHTAIHPYIVDFVDFY